MSHHVHGTDPQHGAVHIKTVEHVVHIMVFVFPVEQDFFLFVFFQIFAGCYQEPGCAAGRIADDLFRFRVHQFYHHFDDMPWGSELSVDSGSCQFGQEILIHISPGIGFF